LEELMETFRIGLPHGWFGDRLGGRNTLVRTSDRIEAVMAALVVLIGVLAIPVAAALGTAFYELRSQAVAHRATLVRPVTATVTGSDRVVKASPTSIVYSAPITWNSLGVRHIGRLQSANELSAGDPVTIWVDDSGLLACAPESPRQVVIEAFVVAVMLWTLVMAICQGIRWLLCRALDHSRSARWDQELRTLLT
jgi:hypothetical protein